jgi:pimeloyl-ACP methyl ester carboxylesterase
MLDVDRPANLGLRAAVGAQEPVTRIDTNGLHLAATRRGRGMPVLCLHAIGHGARDFDQFAKLVGDEFEVIAVDWPGQGLSPDDRIAPTAAHYEKIAHAALDALKLDRVILLGNSIGGAAALRLAASAPERVTGLVLCNAGGLAPVTPFARFVIRQMIAFFGAGERGASWFPRAFGLYYRQLVLPRAPARAQCDRIVASACEIAALLRAAWEGFDAPDSDLRARVADVGCPVFLAWAKSDQIIAWSRSKPAAQKFRDKRIELFRGGHAAFLEDPERFARAFRRFAHDK